MFTAKRFKVGDKNLTKDAVVAAFLLLQILFDQKWLQLFRYIKFFFDQHLCAETLKFFG